MTRDRLAVAGLGALVAVALVVALIEVGGPARGALEKRDDARFADLMQLQNQISCVRNGQRGALPDGLAPTPDCDYGAPVVDPATGAAYRYERVGEDAFRLCAAFEDPARIARRAEPRLGSFEDGCLTFTPEPWVDRRR